MKHFAPLIKKLGLHILKKITTDVIMNEKPSQLSILLDKENQKTDNEKKLDDIITRALKGPKKLESTSLTPTQKNQRKGMVIGSIPQPSYLEYLLRSTEQRPQYFNHITPLVLNNSNPSLTSDEQWQQHVNNIQQEGYDSLYDVYASNYRFDSENEQKGRSR